MSQKPMKNLFTFSTKGKRIAILAIAMALFITTTSLVLIDGKKKTVSLALNGKQTELRTAAATVEELLAANDIQVKTHDYLEPSMDTPIEHGLAILWKQAKKVTIDVDGKTQELWTTEQTVQNVLKKANVDVTTHDEVEPALAANISDNQPITVEKAFQVIVKDGGKESTHWSTSTTVADFLRDQNIRLTELDKVEGDSKAKLTASNATVNIARVEKVTDVVEESENFKVQTKTDPKLLKGREKVVQEGKKGKVQRRFEVTKKNGKVVSRELVSEKVIEKPTHKVVRVGSKVMVASANSQSDGNVGVSRSDAPSGGREFYANASAYTAYCNGCSGTTATGIDLRANPNLKVIAVDPSVIPLGSKVWVEGYGYAVAGDTGGAIKGNRIDLHMPTKAQAYQFGRRQVKIKVIN
ncbi:3D/G5 domain protein [Sporosarcina newyorkensis 2681]|uniref:3D/G5 domain protein n=1 Tax=Sporosarcina newyorkensis 2681 TaxID=1027292 RepID=F9DV90_9BACL|nr:G5 and 3D domain-containing protein [Sporosarcina newyorkensis]EGQ23208.1 3D/G5 domain protein [Sporosarcina newyorkensis 2681]